MARRRVWRFAVEAAFLAAVAALVTVADLHPVAVIALMALAWVVVALFEWAAWLDEPHYGRGLPPRFYVPQVALPPPRPVEQPRSSYPMPSRREDEPTVVASPGDWRSAPDGWPLLDSSSVGEETEIALPDGPPPEFPPAITHPALARPETLEEEEEEVVAAEAPPELEPAPVAEPPEPAAGREARRRVVERPAAEVEALSSFELPEVAAVGVARHHVDPLAQVRRRGLRRRPPRESGEIVEVPDRPPAERALPSTAPGEGEAP